MLTRENIREELNRIMLSAGEKDISGFADSARLQEDVGLSSIGMLYLVISIEEAFGIDFGDASVLDFPTLGSVLDFVEEKLREKA